MPTTGRSTRAHPGPKTRKPSPARPEAPAANASSPERLQKALAAGGFGSRRQVETLISQGRVSVNGRVATLGQRVSADDSILINGRPVRLSSRGQLPRVLLYHKPSGEIVSRSDPRGRPTVFERLPEVRDARWVAVGRLDFNTSGLLLFTDSGELAHRLMHPSFGLLREYAVRVLGELSHVSERRLLEGVKLEDGLAQLESISEAGGEGLNRWYTVTLREGRNREVRRLFSAVGLTVSRLIRVGYGDVRLPRQLRQGQLRELGAEEVEQLLQSTDAIDGDAPAALF